MLLRWLVNNYFRDAAAGKLRQVTSELLDSHASIRASRPQATDPLAPNLESRAAEFLPCDVAFLFALGIESGGLVDQLQNAETSRHPHGIERAGKLHGREVVIVESGVGQKAAARATAEAIKFYQPRWVVSAGFAGGLTDELRRGHIVMADEIASAAGDRLAIGLKLDRESLAATKGLHVGRLLTVDALLREPAERRGLAQEHGAIAADMETFAVARVCHTSGVPFLAVRIISDAVDDELPPEIEHLLAQKSFASKLGAATGAILKRFSAAKDLWKLREDALKASDRLAKFLVGMIDQLR
jgi:adenosylhomocysteine nucleosidase